MKNFKFKLVDIAFNFKKLASYDQEYLRTMVFNTIGERSVKCTGVPFNDMYPHANNFTLFDDEVRMLNEMSEYQGDYASTASHLLDGKKYWFAWTFSV
jgi:hypothetical protein